MEPEIIFVDAGPTVLDFPEAKVSVVAQHVAAGVGPGFFNLDNVLAYQNAILIVVAWSITELLSRATRKMSNEDMRSSVLTVLPLLLCIGFVLATANWQPHATVGERVLLGCLLGTFTVWGHKVAKATGLHDKFPLLKLIMAEKDDEPKDVDPPPSS